MNVGVVAVRRNVAGSKVPAVRVKVVAVMARPRIRAPETLFTVKLVNVVAVLPLIVWSPVPLKVYAALPEVKVVALLTKLPAKVGVLAAILFQTAPELSVTSPVNTCVRAVVWRFIVPVIDVAPSTAKIREVLRVPPLAIVSAPKVMVVPVVVAVSEPPLLIVTDPAAVCVTVASTVTAWAIITASPVPGTVPPGHGALTVVELQAPAPAVVTVAAQPAGTQTKVRKVAMRVRNSLGLVFMRKRSGWGFGIKVGEGMLNQRMKGETKKLKTDGRGQASDHGPLAL